jgi:hypothetical protein
MHEKPANLEATRAADSYMAGKKARTGRWWGRSFAGLATSVLAYAAAVAIAPFCPVGLAIGAGLRIASFGAAVFGGISAVIGTGSGISNALSGA